MLEIVSGTDLRPIDKTLIHASDWSASQSQYFQLIGSYSPTTPGPHGQKQNLRSVSTGGNGWTGGWDGYVVPTDNTKLHRVSCWVNIKNKGGAVEYGVQRGYIYLGTNWSGPNPVQTLDDGSDNLNPYFHVTHVDNLPQNEWLLLVGFVHPVDTPLQPARGETGIWQLSTQSQILNGWNDFRFKAGTTKIMNRCYHYYDQIPGIEVIYSEPRIDVCDGSEPTIAQLLNGYGVNMRKRPIVV